MRDPRPFSEMSDIEPERNTGMLWAINRYLLHPRGFALTFHFDDDQRLTGWSIQGDGREVWAFAAADDDKGFAGFESFLARLGEA